MDKYIGTVLGGRYEILEVLGVGGMAIVYKAYCRVLNRYVAIKMLKEEFVQDNEFRRRFYNESQAVAKLSHNNIVAIYDVVHSDGLDYIVMELIDGITLKEFLQKKGHLSWQETVFFAEQIARALEHAHSRGIIHQDIKPHNIMLLRDGTAKVTDFGIARLESNQETRVMQEAIGSVHYIAPEQAKGSPIDARVDIYSLGVVMYEMLTGKLPFEGDSAVAIVMQHINSVPLMPSEIVPGIPKGMDEIVMHAMSPNASKRYPTAQALYNDLERIKQNPNAVFTYTQHDTRGSGPMLDETRAISYQHGAKAEQPAPRRDERRASDRQDADGDYAPRRPRKKKQRSPVALAAAVVAVIAVVAIVAGVLLLSGGGSERVEVPSFIGQNIDDVLAAQETDYADFTLVEKAERVYDPDYNEGDIIDQDPESGRMVAVGTRIELTVCGPEEEQDQGYTLIDFSDMELDQVVRLLTQNGLENAYSTVEEASDTIDEGRVIRSEPGAGTTVTADDTITLYVSTGPEQTTVGVPDVRGMTLERARSMLESYGLSVGQVRNEENDQTAGQVFRQSVSPDTQVEAGTSVDLYVSTGPSQQEPTPGTSSETGGETGNETGGETGGETDPSGDSGASGSSTGTALVPVNLPDSSSCHVRIYLGTQLLYEHTFSPAGGQQNIEVTGPAGDQMLDIYIGSEKTSNIYTFN